MRRMYVVLLLALAIVLPAPASASERVLTLGVFAYRPKPIMEERYGPLAVYLSQQLKGVRIELLALDQAEMEDALARNALDLVFTNPSHYVILRSGNSLTGALATQISKASGIGTPSLGGVIVARADDLSVQKLVDARGRTIAIPGPKFLGGYQTQMFELLDAGIGASDVRLRPVGSHDAALNAVLEGRSDLGFIRTGIIEELERAGKLDPARLRVLNPQKLAGFPYRVSTRLYPEWPFVALPHLEPQLTAKIAAALLSLDERHPASLAAGIAGFAPPADYLPVENLARALRVPPFDQPITFSAADVVRRYWVWLSIGGALFLVIALLSVRLMIGNRHLANARRLAEQTANALAHEKQHLATLVETLPDLVWLKDEHGVYLDCNPRFEAFFGKPKAEIIGRTDYDFVDRELADMFRKNDLRAIERGVASVNEEWVTFSSDGHRELLETTKVPMRTVEGRLVGVLGIGHDITERKQMQEALQSLNESLEVRVEERTRALLGMEQRASLILQSSAAGLYGVDRDGKLIFINEAACRMLRLDADAALGRRAHDLFHYRRADGSVYPIEACPTHLALTRGDICEVVDEVYWTADGAPLPVMVWIHPMHQDGHHTGAVVSFVDVRKQREAEIAKDQALMAAERLAKVRSEFVANMSHEIRTPLNGILGFADIGLRNLDDRQKVENAFAKVRQSGRHLLGVINDVLDFSKIEAGKLIIERGDVDLRECVETAVSAVEDLAKSKGLSLRASIDPVLPAHCTGDPLRIRQILLNLLSNAVKFTGQGEVTLSAAADGGRLLLRVRDTGIGMTAEQISHVFDPFVQADASSTRRFGGTGLGLAITKRLVEMLEGTISVSSEPGVGSEFLVSLPLLLTLPTGPAQSSGGAPAPVAAPGTALLGISVLVAEDNLVNREILLDNLLSEGAGVVAVENGQEAWERVIDLGPAAFDVVLMDLQMPVMGGLEAAKRISGIAPTLPIIGQTAHAMDEDRERCLAAGMVAHIAKPIDFDALITLIHQHATRR